MEQSTNQIETIEVTNHKENGEGLDPCVLLERMTVS